MLKQFIHCPSAQRALSLTLGVGLLVPSLLMVMSGFETSQAAPRSRSHSSNVKVYHGSTSYVRQMRVADQLLQTGRFHDAETKYQGLLKQNPNDVQARSGLAFAQAELFKLDAAEENARKVLSKDFNNTLAHVTLGVSYRNRTASQDMTYKTQRDHYLSESAKELEKAIELDPDSPDAHNQLGVTYRFQGRTQDAQRAFEQANNLDPEFAEALVNQGIMQMEAGNITGAKKFYQQSIQRNSKNYMAHYRLGEALVKERDLHKAIRSLNTALSLNRGNAAVMAELAEAYEQQGNVAAAVANYRNAMSSNPGFMPAYTGLANLLDRRGDGELAMAELKSALNINPMYNQGRNQLGRLALNVDKPDQALQYFKESLMVNPNDADAIYGISQALTISAQKTVNNAQAMGQESDIVNAEEAVQEALRLNPNSMRLHLASVRISQLAGKPDDSRDDLERILQKAPRNDVESMMQGEAFLALGRYEESDKVFKDLMQNARGDVDKLLVLGDTLKSNGDLARAREAYQLVSQEEPSNLKAQRGIQRISKLEADSQKTLRLANALNNRKQKASSVDYYEETLKQNPRQPEARLALAKIYEKNKDYTRAVNSYQYYLGLMSNMTLKERQQIQKKITKLQTLASKSSQPESRHADKALTLSKF